MNLLVKNIKPSIKELKDYISYYIFSSNKYPELKLHYTFYPHVNNTLAIYKDSIIQTEGCKSIITKSNVSTVDKVYYGRTYESPIEISISGSFEKTTIVFHPLGINYFLKSSLSSLSSDIFFEFRHWTGEITGVVDQLFQEPDFVKKGLILDQFFIGKLIGFSKPNLEYALRIMFNSNDNNISQIANLLNINRKTLHRLFKQHLATNPKIYHKVIRFRRAIHQHLTTNEATNLTTLAHKTGYYDQSSLIRDFRMLTGNNPKLFFDHIKQIGTEETYFKFT